MFENDVGLYTTWLRWHSFSYHILYFSNLYENLYQIKLKKVTIHFNLGLVNDQQSLLEFIWKSQKIFLEATVALFYSFMTNVDDLPSV